MLEFSSLLRDASDIVVFRKRLLKLLQGVQGNDKEYMVVLKPAKGI